MAYDRFSITADYPKVRWLKTTHAITNSKSGIQELLSSLQNKIPPQIKEMLPVPVASLDTSVIPGGHFQENFLPCG